MGRQSCTVCAHAQREEADVLLAVGVFTQKEIAGKLGVSPSALSRHARNHRRDMVISYLDELKEQVVGIARKSMEKEVLPELRRLREQLTPHATLRRAFEDAGLDSMGARTVALDKLVTALVEERAYTPASRFLENAGFDTDTARAIVATVAQKEGVDPEVVLLEILWEHGRGGS